MDYNWDIYVHILMVKYNFWLNETSFLQINGTEALRMWKIGKGELFAKMLENFEKWRKYPCFENAASDRNFEI